LRIIFDLRNVGLGNNGGSLTLIKSANALQELGNEVYMIDSMKNQHTWTVLKVPHIVIRKEKQIPDSDAIIATGYKSVGTTVNAPSRCGIKVHWLRAWELWQGSENWIVKKVLTQPTLKIVNSICLQNKLKQHGFESHIIRPGNDFEDLYPTGNRDNKTVVLGGLYHTRHTTKRSDWVLKVGMVLKNKYNNIRLHMFGANKNLNNLIVDKYVSQPNISQKNKFFNEVDIFLSPTCLEGLHIVPQEAMLTECSVVSTNAEMSGTQDYIIHGVTGYMSENNLKSFTHYVELLYNKPDMRKHMGENARVKIRTLGNRKENMQKLAAFLEQKKGV